MHDISILDLKQECQDIFIYEQLKRDISFEKGEKGKNDKTI